MQTYRKNSLQRYFLKNRRSNQKEKRNKENRNYSVLKVKISNKEYLI